ncbi:MAG: ribonuclease III [Acidimicrobiia bacterium]
MEDVISLPLVRINELLERLGLDVPAELLVRALVHRSWCAENPGHDSNERLEFLGDAVLGMAVTDRIFRDHPDVDEGVLTEIRKSVVNSVTLAEVAEEFGVGDHLLLGKGEAQSGGRLKPSILADSVEAIIGATYLHSGFEAACELVDRLLGERLASAPLDGADFKSRLQELVAQRHGSTPRYRVEATGPDHARSFHVVATVEGEPVGEGRGRSKKQAEQAAARDAWSRLVATSGGEVR